MHCDWSITCRYMRLTQSTDNSIMCQQITESVIDSHLHVEPTRFIFYGFTSHVYYFRLEIYNKTTIEFSLWFSPLDMYNKTIIGFGFCDMQNYQCLGKSYHPCLRLG